MDPPHVSDLSPNETQWMARESTKSPPLLLTRTPAFAILEESQMVSEMESATIHRQRRELELLISELRDRDGELNTMVAGHHNQLKSWEQDRQRVLTLEQRCARLNDELGKRNEVIRAMTKQLQILEVREKDGQSELNLIRNDLHKLEQKQQLTSQQHLDQKIGALQVREQEFSAMLKLKDVREATKHILELTRRVREMETALKESHIREARVRMAVVEHNQHQKEARHENSHLRAELSEQVNQSNAQREEITRLKQEGQLMHRALALSGEGESWKDELLALAHSKQERTEAELHCLRQVCENQQNDMQLLQLNLESAREALQENESQTSHGREGQMWKHMTSEGTEGEGIHLNRHTKNSTSVHLQNPNHNPPPFPTAEGQGQREQEESVSELDTDFTDVTMTTFDLFTNPTPTCSVDLLSASSLAERREDLISHGPHTYTISNSSYISPNCPPRSPKSSLTFNAVTNTQSQESVGQTSTSNHLSLSNQSMEMTDGSRYDNKGIPSIISRNSLSISSCTPGGTPGFTLTIEIPKETLAEKQAGHSPFKADSLAVGLGGHRPGKKNTCRRSTAEGSWGNSTAVLDQPGNIPVNTFSCKSSSEGRKTKPSCGCNSTSETTNCSESSSFKIASCGSSSAAEGHTDSSRGCSCIHETAKYQSSDLPFDQTRPSSSKTSSRCRYGYSIGNDSCTTETASCCSSSVAEGPFGPSCGCTSGVEGQIEAEPSMNGPSRAKPRQGEEVELMAVLNRRTKAKTSTVLLLDVSPRAPYSATEYSW